MSAKLSDKSLIAVGLLASKMEVAMKCLHLISQFLQDNQQGNRICASAYAHQNRSLFLENLVCLYVSPYSLSHFMSLIMPAAKVSPKSTAFCRYFLASALFPF